MIEVPFVGASYEMDSLDISAQRTVNLFPEVYDDGKTKTVISLRNTPGLLLAATQSYGANKGRCLYKSSTNRLFSVRGDGVAEFDTAFSETSRFLLSSGATEPTSSIVKMCDNGVQMLIIDGALGYTYNLNTNIATAIADADFPDDCTHCDILDGFYIVNVPNTTLCYYSALDDPTTWATLSSLSKEGTSDYVNSLIVLNRRLWVFGSQSYEVFYNTGDANNQFSRYEGSYHEIGNQAPYSLAKDESSIYWLGSNAQGFGKIYKSVQGGFDFQPISTKAVEIAIRGYTSTTDAEGICYQQDGNDFYKISFPTDNKTWVFNNTTGLWHEESYRNAINNQDERHRARNQVFFNGKNYVNDCKNGNIYEISSTTYTDNGDEIIKTRISPTHWNSQERLYFDSFQLGMEVGVGLDGGVQGYQPKLYISISDDGGHVYKAQTEHSIGEMGEYELRVKRDSCGSSRKRVWKVECSEPVRFVINNAFAEVS